MLVLAVAALVTVELAAGRVVVADVPGLLSPERGGHHAGRHRHDPPGFFDSPLASRPARRGGGAWAGRVRTHDLREHGVGRYPQREDGAPFGGGGQAWS